MKDFFDIYYLSGMFDFDGRKLQEAISQTIQHRGTSYEANSIDRIAAFGDNVFLSALWTRFQPSIQVQLPEFASVLYRLTEFIQPVFEASIQEREFFMDWSAEQKKWKEQIKNSLLLEDILTKDVLVSKKEMESYYKENKSLFDVPTAYHLSHIIVKTKQEAKKALKELSQGSSFSALAMERSIEEFSANQGGDIGYISEMDDQYPEKYIQVAKKLKSGKWSNPIKVDQGYAIIQLHGVIHGKKYAYKEVKDQIRRQIAMEQMKTPASARTFWDEAKVDWFYGNKAKK
jgi:hypothetical protein